VYLSYPLVVSRSNRLIVIGSGKWFVLNRSRPGMLIRLASTIAISSQHRACAASNRPGLRAAWRAAGIVGGTFQSLSPGEDTRFLLASLVVVIVGGMGSIPGAALGAVIIGLAEQVGLVYAPTYSVVFTFLIMAAVLAFRPQGLLGAKH
jgi:branched-chain amino acid transport system permease protein